MRIWRIAQTPYTDLTGEGARLYGGRWNSPGRPMVYTAENPALAALEIRVHLDIPPELQPDNYVLIAIETGNAAINEMPSDIQDPRAAGDNWLSQLSSPIVRVPSIIVPESYNFLINPRHPASPQISVEFTKPISFDPRLWALESGPPLI